MSDDPSLEGARGHALAHLIDGARALLADGRIAEAEHLLVNTVRGNERDPDLMELLAEFYLEVNRTTDAARVLARCIEIDPRRSGPYFMLADILARQNRLADVVTLFTRLATVTPRLPAAHFNLAVYLRRMNRLEESIAAYRRALELRIDCPADAWSNIGVILGELGRHAEAREAFQHALTADPAWVPAIYNLGLLHEEFGERDAAVERFKHLLEIDPGYYDALVRLVHAQTIEHPIDPLVARIRSALARTDLLPAMRESLAFALGKALDDCGAYDEAFAAFQSANTLAHARMRPYDRAASERDNQAILDRFDATWLRTAPAVSSTALVFICGMFRSGTTLLEQMLAAHPALTAGGEITYFNAQLDRRDGAYPVGAATASPSELRTLGLGYLELLSQRFPGAERVINKRPDTFRYLGLLHGLFPEARFVIMRRDPLDTCLSIYFQQLGNELPYATDLGDTAHFLLGYRTLLEHWKGLFAHRIIEIEYEKLVTGPERELRRACDFLELPWSDAMLQFTANRGRVRTASVWQVREPLHARSIGRWRHYATHIDALATMLNTGDEADEP